MQPPLRGPLQQLKARCVHHNPHSLGRPPTDLGDHALSRAAGPSRAQPDHLREHEGPLNRPHRPSLPSHNLGAHDRRHVPRRHGRRTQPVHPTASAAASPPWRLSKPVEETVRSGHILCDRANRLISRPDLPETSQSILARYSEELQRLLVRSGADLWEEGEWQCDAGWGGFEL